MKSADLRDRVGFYKRTVSSDGYGNDVSDFPAQPEFTVAANIKPRLGSEQVLQSRLQGVHLANITVRSSGQTKQVTPEWCAKNERTGEVYNIRSIIDPAQADGDHSRWLEMLCEKGGAV
jgi:head-tail adaptor